VYNQLIKTTDNSAFHPTGVGLPTECNGRSGWG